MRCRPDDPETLRTRLLGRAGRARATRSWPAASPLARADPAAWAVAALLDDLALNTPWGGASAWPRQPLVVDAARRRRRRRAVLRPAGGAGAPPEPRPRAARAAISLPRARLPRQIPRPGRAGDRSHRRGARRRRALPARRRGRKRAAVAELAGRRSPPTSRAASPCRSGCWRCGGRCLATAIYVRPVACASAARPTDLPRWSARCRRRSAPRSSRPVPSATHRVAGGRIEPVDFALLPEFRAAAPGHLRRPLKGSESVSLATLVIQWTNPEVFRPPAPS